MIILFTQWSVEPKNRTPVAVDPSRVECVEHYGDAFVAVTGEEFPAASRVVMRNKREYIVQGTVEDTMTNLNWGSGDDNE